MRHPEQTQQPFVTAVEVARRFHLSYQTVNYYTNLGLLVTARKRGNQRLYHPRQTADRLKRIESLKHEGYPLKLISRVLSGDHGSAGQLSSAKGSRLTS